MKLLCLEDYDKTTDYPVCTDIITFEDEVEQFMIDIIENEYFALKLIITLMFFVLVITITSLFYRLHRDKILKNRKQDFKSKIISLLEIYFEKSGKVRERALEDMRLLFVKDKDFRDVMIAELRKRVENEDINENYRKLFIELGGMGITQNELLSKNPVTIYKGLLDVDFFRLCPPKEDLLRLQKHHDIRIKILVACILFRYNEEINADDILTLEPVLSPMVEIKIFDELKKRAVSSSQKMPVRDVLEESLDRNISDKMRDFLQKSLQLIDL